MMIKGFFGKSVLIGVTLSFFTIHAFAAEYTANPFKTPPSGQVTQTSPAPGGLPPGYDQALKNQQAGLGGIVNTLKDDSQDGLNNVMKTLTEKEVRSQKILEAVNGKMAKAKNIPVENARYIGIINGKRVYQDNDTQEYVKIDLDK